MNTVNTVMPVVEQSAFEKLDKNGHGQFWKPIGERILFSDRDENKYEFVDYWSKTKDIHLIRAWLIKAPTDYALVYITVQSVSSEELKRLEIWDKLSDFIQKGIESHDVKQEVIVQEKMDHARKHRVKNPEFANLPSTIKCTKCEDEKNVPPAQIIKRAKAKNITPEEFIKIFVCLKCDPSQRGRKASAKYANMAKELHCSHEGCSVTKKQHPSMTEKAAEAAGITYTEYVNTWLCKEHKPAKPHHFSKEGREVRGRKGRPANPEHADIPKEINCKGCGKLVKLVPANIIEKAGILKMEVKDLVANYKCRGCGGRLSKAMIKAAKKEAKKKAKS